MWSKKMQIEINHDAAKFSFTSSPYYHWDTFVQFSTDCVHQLSLREWSECKYYVQMKRMHSTFILLRCANNDFFYIFAKHSVSLSFALFVLPTVCIQYWIKIYLMESDTKWIFPLANTVFIVRNFREHQFPHEFVTIIKLSEAPNYFEITI